MHLQTRTTPPTARALSDVNETADERTQSVSVTLTKGTFLPPGASQAEPQNTSAKRRLGKAGTLTFQVRSLRLSGKLECRWES